MRNRGTRTLFCQHCQQQQLLLDPSLGEDEFGDAIATAEENNLPIMR
jgi:hypothetical protein